MEENDIAFIDYELLRYVDAKFIIDTNLINAKGELEYINQLEKWANDHVIVLYTSEATFSDLSNEGNIGWSKKRKQKARQKPIILPFINVDGNYQDIKARLTREFFYTAFFINFCTFYTNAFTYPNNIGAKNTTLSYFWSLNCLYMHN